MSAFTSSTLCTANSFQLDIGQSCTYVITKYTLAPETQELEYSSLVEFYDLPVIGNVLGAALNDWYIFYHQPDPAWTPQDQVYYKSRATTCLTLFRAVLCSYAPFQSDEQATAELHLMSSRSGPNRITTIQYLVEMVETGLQPFKRADGVYVRYTEADCTEKLWELLDPFVTEAVDNDEASPWPLVKQVTIGVRGSRMLESCVLVDMPGISDTNQVRVDATQQFLTQCDHLVVVARVGRVIDDPAVSSLLQRYGKAMAGNITIVSTMSDDNINDKVATRMANLAFSIGNYSALKSSSDLMQSQVKALQRTKKKMSAKDVSKQQDLDRQICDLQTRKQATENSRWELVVKARNEHVADGLRKARQGDLPTGVRLRVFGVSNKHYEKLQTGDKSGEYLLSAEGTGIPALRKYFLRLIAPLKWNALKGFVATQPNVLVPGFDMWAGSGTLVENRAALLKVVKKQGRKFEPQFQDYKGSLRTLVENDILNALQDAQPQSAASAVGYARQTWSNYQWNTLKAFCSRNGSHKTSVLSESWNDHFTTESTKAIKKSWESFTSSRKALSERMGTSIIEAVQAVPQALRGEKRSKVLF